jgi:hypothetical protein
MTTSPTNVPNVPVDPMYELQNDKIVLTSQGKTFFESFINYFINNFSSEGLVAPNQSTSSINSIQNNTLPDGSYTCQYGTLIYNSNTNKLMVALNNGSNIPIFYNILTSADPVLMSTDPVFMLL